MNIAIPKSKILLVDDLEENLVALEALVRGPERQILTARGGTQALELLLENDVALALVDVQMPEMDGFTLAELMRGTERTRHIPIILLTAGAQDPKRVFHGYDAGAVDFLFKPIEPAILLNKVETFVQLQRQRVQLEQTLRLNEMFMAVLGHDLRNPVSTVVNTAAALAESPDAQARRQGNRLLSVGLRMGRMINDLLDLARMRLGGGIPLAPRPVELGPLVRRVVEEMRAANPDCELIVQGPEDAAPGGGPAGVHGRWDEDRLCQLVSNLIANACQHGEEGAPIDVAYEAAQGDAVITVANHGHIAPELLPVLFDPFRSGVRRRGHTASGLGLGLFIVQQIAAAHGGRVDVASDGRRVTFCVRLPLGGPPQPNA